MSCYSAPGETSVNELFGDLMPQSKLVLGRRSVSVGFGMNPRDECVCGADTEQRRSIGVCVAWVPDD